MSEHVGWKSADRMRNEVSLSKEVHWGSFSCGYWLMESFGWDI